MKLEVIFDNNNSQPKNIKFLLTTLEIFHFDKSGDDANDLQI